MTKKPENQYHPANLPYQVPFSHDDGPPQSDRVVVTDRKPILYDSEERPIYRKIGFR